MRILGSIALLVLVLAGCATPEKPRGVAPPEPVISERRSVRPPPRAVQPRPVLSGAALVARLLPPRIDDRSGWAAEIHGALAALGLPVNVESVCTVVAITEQESGFRADPPVPGLAQIASREIERRRESARIPRLLVRAALALPSSDGRSYRERLQVVRTESELSGLYEDFARRMPLPKGFFIDQNPVRTGGPMQVSIQFAETHAAVHPYPYAPSRSIRDEVFTRRGGLYFGIAHLLHYPAPYDDPVYRFADYNAGRFASRNAAFQKAVSEASGVPLQLDGDLLQQTEAAALRLAERLGMSADHIRRDLALGTGAEFERTRLYSRVFALAGERAPRALVPAIEVNTLKTRRTLTTDGFAKRAAARYLACLARL